jgi:hypothetical protein
VGGVVRSAKRETRVVVVVRARGAFVFAVWIPTQKAKRRSNSVLGALAPAGKWPVAAANNSMTDLYPASEI